MRALNAAKVLILGAPGDQEGAGVNAPCRQERDSVNEGLLSFSLTHKTAGPQLRSRLFLDEPARAHILDDLARHSSERMILSTCERLEMYAVNASPDSCAASIAQGLKASPEEVISRMAMRTGETAAEHLLRVAAGLDSRILGEPQILCQVRRAFLEADASRALGPVLNALGRAAVHGGRRVRRETSLNDTTRSIASLAVEHAVSQIGSWTNRSVTILGSGQLAGDIAQVLSNVPRISLQVLARHPARALSVARRAGGCAGPIEDVGNALSQSDVLFACAATPNYLVNVQTIAPLDGRPRVFVDLAVPRSIDPAVTSVPGISLVHLDELLEAPGPESTKDRAPVPPMGWAESLAIVAAEMARYSDWLRGRSAAPKIAELVRGAPRAPAADAREAKRRLHRDILALKSAVAA